MSNQDIMQYYNNTEAEKKALFLSKVAASALSLGNERGNNLLADVVGMQARLLRINPTNYSKAQRAGFNRFLH